MEELYAEDWDDEEKRGEITEEEARFIIATDKATGLPKAFEIILELS